MADELTDADVARLAAALAITIPDEDLREVAMRLNVIMRAIADLPDPSPEDLDAFAVVRPATGPWR